MSGDLLTLRTVVVSDLRQHRQIWCDAAALASVPVDVVETDWAGVSEVLRGGNLDVLLLDGDLTNREAAIKSARLLKPRPLIAVSTAGTGKVEGADIVIPRPKNADDARKQVERCVNMRKPKRVLVVDDSTTMRSIVRKILSASRYVLEVQEAEEGLGALKSLNAGIDLVLLDYNMPGLNGFETMTEIKRAAPQVNVVMMTSTDNVSLIGKAEAAGAVGFLKKPFYPADIDAVLDMLYRVNAR